jgi:hypothetical protein
MPLGWDGIPGKPYNAPMIVANDRKNSEHRVCGVVDNSPVANRAACRGKRFAFPTAPLFAHSLHR